MDENKEVRMLMKEQIEERKHARKFREIRDLVLIPFGDNEELIRQIILIIEEE